MKKCILLLLSMLFSVFTNAQVIKSINLRHNNNPEGWLYKISLIDSITIDNTESNQVLNIEGVKVPHCINDIISVSFSEEDAPVYYAYVKIPNDSAYYVFRNEGYIRACVNVTGALSELDAFINEIPINIKLDKSQQIHSIRTDSLDLYFEYHPFKTIICGKFFSAVFCDTLEITHSINSFSNMSRERALAVYSWKDVIELVSDKIREHAVESALNKILGIEFSGQDTYDDAIRKANLRSSVKNLIGIAGTMHEIQRFEDMSAEDILREAKEMPDLGGLENAAYFAQYIDPTGAIALFNKLICPPLKKLQENNKAIFEQQKKEANRAILMYDIKTGDTKNITCNLAICSIKGFIKAEPNNGFIDFDYGICYSTNSLPTIEQSVKSNETNAMHITHASFTLNSLKPSTTYYYRAFLKDNITGEITYADNIEHFTTDIEHIPAKITNFEQNNATFNRDGFEYKEKTYYYDFAATTTVELENNDDVVDWGYVYIDPYGEADTISVAGLGSNPAKDSRYHYYRSTPNATATLYGYSKYADGTFVFDEPKDYDLVYTFHPTAYVGNVITDSLTSTSAQFEYGFDDIPRTGKCFTAVQSARDDEPIVKEVSYAEKDTVKFADLFPGTTYKYWAYVEYAGMTYASDKKSLTTLTPIAHVEKADDDKVTMTSAEIGYGFANVPENAKCYVGISAKVQTVAGDGEEINKSYSQTFSVENTTGATYEFNGLYPSTTYTYYAYVEYEGETWFSDGEKFTTKAPPTPVATTGDCSAVTTNSSTMSCSFENVPEGGICGVEYTWSNGSQKQSIGNVNGTQTITISGLESGTTYSYRAYVEAYGQTYYGGEKTFTTQVKLPDLSGTWYCTIYKDDGSVLETPTLTLTSDGKATQTGSSFTSSDRVGGWSININGKVGIGFNWTSGNYNPVYWQEAYSGTVNSMTSPSSIEGTVSRRWAGTSEHGNSYTFKMIR